ncbi:alpha-beta hydrolase superfamily lysophospholipase [Kineosphaera limosa]|uniref:Putative monoacylglycerol lipase n=1 Tax=Kineosphaera limosa NBRC 100340 TaxID=1184609 RepID=K6WDH0_9MICO|nr:alpha/beta hydrolase [Kineosphaera limosa]NYE01630.1 alpha-beta hydrolase superfamily lysophospholipase [Kineosphaera limosa]GAB97295.1 putative monoacylglycerol lipase [Kineosphaera limosa NBRC 100340]
MSATLEATDFTLPGHAGDLQARRWQTTPHDQNSARPRYLVLLCHGYGKHLGRYEWVAERLVADGAAVYALDHVGHGRSAGERVLIPDYEPVVEDFRRLHEEALLQHAGLPVVLIGHSMGGMIAIRYAQLYGAELTCTVLSGPVMGRWEALEGLLAAQEIPDVPIDPDTLSRDPQVGADYVADPLVWHGPFKRETLHGLRDCLTAIAAGGSLEGPVLWLHGEDDQLVPRAGSANAWPVIRGDRSRAKSYPQARHEIFNETNRDEVLADVIAFVHENIADLNGDR